MASYLVSGEMDSSEDSHARCGSDTRDHWATTHSRGFRGFSLEARQDRDTLLPKKHEKHRNGHNEYIYHCTWLLKDMW